ncbi:CHAD domain-containing protein [Caballeronia sp. dw_19]|uniref:CHAD domain-containing protein n=1 Tax=Caballeronia sp. dw_19 TaxID=2719791 RepID=UPI001BD448AA|nr:CHAD domain-containing protein [Caballeronia sp. dw_19]
MLQLVELMMVALDAPNGPPAEALARLSRFATARRTDFVLRSHKARTKLVDWEVAIETDDDHRIFVARRRDWPLIRRIETEAGPFDTLHAWIKSEAVLTDLKTLLGDASFTLSEATETAIVEWDTPGEMDTGVHVRATLRLDPDHPAMLTLTAAPDAREALFATAHEIAETLSFLIVPIAIDRSSREPVRAGKLKLSKDASPTDAFVEIGKSVAAQWFGNDAASRGGLEVEHVHQLRVAQRRLKTALKLFPEWIDGTWTTRVAPDLKWFGDLLGDARDWDVFADATLAAYAASDDSQHKDAWKPTQSAADTHRIAARKRLQDAMNSPRYALLALSFVEWFSTLEAPPKHADQTLAAYAQKRITKHYRKIERAPDLTTLDAPTRHKVRIHAKRLRYALEFFRSLLTRETRKEVEEALGNLQSVLGDGNDAAVAAQRLADLKEASDFQKGLAKGFAVNAQRMSAMEGERILRKIKPPRIK